MYLFLFLHSMIQLQNRIEYVSSVDNEINFDFFPQSVSYGGISIRNYPHWHYNAPTQNFYKKIATCTDNMDDCTTFILFFICDLFFHWVVQFFVVSFWFIIILFNLELLFLKVINVENGLRAWLSRRYLHL